MYHNKINCKSFVSPMLTGTQDSSSSDQLKTLHMELRKKHKAGELDGYCLYVYAVHSLHTYDSLSNICIISNRKLMSYAPLS